MLRYKLLRSKKGEIGETLTWIVATLIIVGILIIFLFLSAGIKRILVEDVKSDLPKESVSLGLKTTLAYNITNEKNKQVITNLLRQDDT
jgi:hypothetical protein